MSHSNETMPEWSPTIRVEVIEQEKLALEKKFWRERYCDLVQRFMNLIDSCHEHGFVDIDWKGTVYRLRCENFEKKMEGLK